MTTLNYSVTDCCLWNAEVCISFVYQTFIKSSTVIWFALFRSNQLHRIGCTINDIGVFGNLWQNTTDCCCSVKNVRFVATIAEWTENLHSKYIWISNVRHSKFNWLCTKRRKLCSDFGKLMYTTGNTKLSVTEETCCCIVCKPNKKNPNEFHIETQHYVLTLRRWCVNDREREKEKEVNMAAPNIYMHAQQRRPRQHSIAQHSTAEQ